MVLNIRRSEDLLAECAARFVAADLVIDPGCRWTDAANSHKRKNWQRWRVRSGTRIGFGIVEAARNGLGSNDGNKERIKSRERGGCLGPRCKGLHQVKRAPS